MRLRGRPTPRRFPRQRCPVRSFWVLLDLRMGRGMDLHGQRADRRRIELADPSGTESRKSAGDRGIEIVAGARPVKRRAVDQVRGADGVVAASVGGMTIKTLPFAREQFGAARG